jgi:myosin-5
MSELIYLDEPHVLENLDMRYSKLRIYTAISNILVAMNPYQVVTQLYNDDTLLSFKMAIERVREPHVFNASKQAYQSMVKTHVNQSMVICGESNEICL